MNTMSVIDLKSARQKLEKRSASQSQSTQNTGSDQTGQLPTDEEMLDVVMAVYKLLMTAKQQALHDQVGHGTCGG